MSELSSFIIVMAFIVVCILLICLAIIMPSVHYKRSLYYKATHKPYSEIRYNKGTRGEYHMYLWAKFMENDGARFLFNCYLPKDNDETTEIDMIMIHTSGIYVFESKNYSGWIFGNEYDKEWTQTLPGRKGVSKEHFLNPIMQNKNHIDCLEKCISENIPIYSMVVFSDKCDFKQVKVLSSNTYVVKQSWLRGYLSSNVASVGYVLSPELIESIYTKLFPYTQVSDYEKAKHVYDIKFKQYVNEVNNTPKIGSDGILYCPWCNGKLILRTTQRGPYAGSQFYGCSNFPKCKYIKNL